MKNLFKYQIGLAILGVFVASMAIILLVQSGAAKDDAKTYKSAEKIADELNNYMYEEYKIPKSLKDAGISESNPNITYKKLSDARYEFCVTYRTKSGGVDGATMLSDAIFGSYDDYYEDDYEPSSLYLDPVYNRGKNCQTIKPYVDDMYQDEQSLQQFDDEQITASDHSVDRLQPQIEYIEFTDEGIKSLNEVTKICAENYTNHEDKEYHSCMKSAYNAYR